MAMNEERMSVHDRMLAILEGRKPDRYPFIGRLELWQRGHLHTGTLPEKYAGMELTDIHRDVGFGRQLMQTVYLKRYRGVEMVVYFNGEEVQRETDPVLDRFPDVGRVIPDKIGETLVEFHTPVGVLTVEYSALETMLAAGARAYMTKHPITRQEDYAITEYILEKAEILPFFEPVYAIQKEYGGDGWVVPTIERIPFQQLLIDFLDTADFFFALNDYPVQVNRLMDILDEHVTEIMSLMADLDSPYIEIGDNVDGMMTNPRLFEQYSMEPYQRLSDMAHAQGKKIGSHMDGDLKPILHLLPECGLDVIESFSPEPLTPVTVEQALELWDDKPLIWGGIPCLYLEADAPVEEMETYVRDLLVMLEGRPMILNVVDMVLPINEIERVQRIAEIIEDHAL